MKTSINLVAFCFVLFNALFLGSKINAQTVVTPETFPYIENGIKWTGPFDAEYKNVLIDRIDSVHQYSNFTWMNVAWEVMMIKQGITPKKNVHQLTGSILKFLDSPLSRKNSFGVMRNYVIKDVGQEIGGNVSMGRTTPPLGQIMDTRYELMKVMVMLYDFQKMLLNLADKYKNTIMPGYTHIRQAQPTTFGHYLLSVYDAIDRSMKSVEHSYHLMNINELGCGALAGTSLPIDRDMTSRYLGLDGLIENANDAVAYTDGYVNVVASLTNVVAIFSRMCMELDMWSGDEYGFMEFGVKRGSVFMPNKSSNQPFLENGSVAAAEILGDLVEVAATGMRCPQGDMHQMLHMRKPVIGAIDITYHYMHSFIFYLPTMQVNEARMLEAARMGYSCSTELANRLVLDYHLDYSTAHDVINIFVQESEKKGISAQNADIDIFEAAARKIAGKEIGISQKELIEFLSPEHFINATNSKGGVAPAEVNRMIWERKQTMKEAVNRHISRIEKLEKAKQMLLSDLKEIYNKSK